MSNSYSHSRVNVRSTSQLEDSLDPFPPPRNSSLPPLESREAQDEFLRSPTAVVESLGLRIPAALSQHIKRRSAPPPPPMMAGEEVSGVQRVADLAPAESLAAPVDAPLPPPPAVPADAVALAVAVAAETKRSRPRARRTKK
jgi:hypothetical protein